MNENQSLPAAARPGTVALKVRDLERSIAYYREVIGLRAVAADGSGAAWLGPAGGAQLLHLQQVTGERAAPNATGLYHFALLIPARVDLARFVVHLAQRRAPLGQADHLVSEALYLNDPDGNGIEVYRDRAPSEWPRTPEGGLVMDNAAIDFDGLLAEPGADVPFAGLPTGTTLGHMHLKVGDIAAAEAFYVGALGFEVQARWQGALFVSAGGYHHHVGLNTWHSRGGTAAPAQAVGLAEWTLWLPSAADVTAMGERLAARGVAAAAGDGELRVADPWGNVARVVAG